jgi:HEAT repeat protein
MTLEQIDELFTQTLTGDYDDDAPWEAVGKLRRLGTRRVFERAADWCASESPLKRARGADVLAQIGVSTDHPNNSFPEESYAIVSGLAEQEKDPLPLLASIHALGHIGNPLAVPLVIEKRPHQDSDVRFAVACALGCFADDPRAAQALTELTQDTDEDVRDWATFGLGVLGQVDSPEIREALVTRLSDTNLDVREEALVGLAKRKDRRTIPVLIGELSLGDLTVRLREASEAFLGEGEEHPEWGAHEFANALRAHLTL